MTPQDFIENYLGCSAEELCSWGEKVDRLPWAGYTEILDWMEEYGKQQWNEAIKLAAEEATYQGGGYTLDQEYEYHTPIGVDKQSILKLLK